MRPVSLAASITILGAGFAWIAAVPPPPSRQKALNDFAVIQRVLQHPRCQNCHIPGDAPLQFDDSRPHAQNVMRGPKGEGAPGLPCSTCHGTENAPDSYGLHMPPGAPDWKLPPPEEKMVFIGLSAGDLCRRIKDSQQNGGRDLEALFEHIDRDKLVLWGWNPGLGRTPVDVPHAEFSAAFRRWIDTGAPCPSQELRSGSAPSEHR